MSRPPAPRRGFTLVEMLVVIGIIAVLAALLLPAVMSAVGRARNTSMSTEIAQLEDALNSYKEDKGDFPPGFRTQDVFLRHLRRCYPKMNPEELQFFFRYNQSTGVLDRDMNNNYVWKTGKQLDEGEALVFWLSLTSADPRKPFTGSPKKVYYDFAAERLADGGDPDPDTNDPLETGWIDPATCDDPTNLTGPRYKSFRPRYAQESAYILIDSRAYLGHVNASADIWAEAENGEFGVNRPYVEKVNGTTPVFMNASTFQILCAGQDGLFDDNATSPWGLAPDYKLFPAGMNYTQADKDNLTNFSDGRTLVDAIP